MDRGWSSGGHTRPRKWSCSGRIGRQHSPHAVHRDHHDHHLQHASPRPAAHRTGGTVLPALQRVRRQPCARHGAVPRLQRRPAARRGDAPRAPRASLAHAGRHLGGSDTAMGRGVGAGCPLASTDAQGVRLAAHPAAADGAQRAAHPTKTRKAMTMTRGGPSSQPQRRAPLRARWHRSAHPPSTAPSSPGRGRPGPTCP